MRMYSSIAVAVIIVFGVVWFMQKPAPEGLPLTIGGVKVYAELALTEEEKGRGLGGRESLHEKAGMLYVFDRRDFHVFSMKDMLFPLDIIWIDEDLTVVDVMENAEPESYPDSAFINDFLAMYVLEVNAGFFDEHNLKLGDPVVFSKELNTARAEKGGGE